MMMMVKMMMTMKMMTANLFKDSFVEELLKFLVAVIYAKLFEAVRLEVLCEVIKKINR